MAAQSKHPQSRYVVGASVTSTLLCDGWRRIGCGTGCSVEADQLIESWKAALNSVQATQHMITNHQVAITGDEATCLSYVQAFHWHPGTAAGDSWTVFGSYEHHLAKADNVWKIVTMKLNLKRQEGNLNLLKQVVSKS